MLSTKILFQRDFSYFEQKVSLHYIPLCEWLFAMYHSNRVINNLKSLTILMFIFKISNFMGGYTLDRTTGQVTSHSKLWIEKNILILVMSVENPLEDRTI